MQQVKAGENHLKDILDWLEEISLRDGIEIAQLVQNLATIVDDPRLGRNDKLKRLKDELRRLRFPRLARIEDEIERRIRELKLSPEISLGVPVGLEGGGIVLKLQAASCEDLQRLAAEAIRAAESENMKEIFAAINGADAGM